MGTRAGADGVAARAIGGKAIMLCPHCGGFTNASGRFCGACGTPLDHPGNLSTVALALDERPAPAAYLLVVSLPDQPERTFPLSGPSMRLGSDRGCELQVDAPGIAPYHALIVAHKGSYVIRDQGSPRGLWVRGRKVGEALLREQGVAYTLHEGAAITFTLRPLTHGAALSGRTGTAADAMEVRFASDQTALSIGRDPGSDLTIDAPLVSRHHARLERAAATYTIRDLGSTNGTYVGGARIRGARTLAIGDEIAIGPVRFTFQGTALQQVGEGPQVRIDAVGLVRRVGGSKGKVLLDHLGLTILPREFVALIGGSGAGKSTLLHALSGAAPAQQGAVLYNGQDFYRHPGPYGAMIGYVPQDDILHRELPVARALRYAARLRLPADMAAGERERRIGAVLAEVQMEKQRDTPINRLSGGQRKRVSIAVELLADPAVLFLDEPTSGLDPGLDKTVMALLRGLCETGHTIVLVTHATENIGQCDLVAFLVGGGRLAYYGPPDEAPAHFGVAAFPDIYAQVNANPDLAESYGLRFRASPSYTTYVEERQLSTEMPVIPDTPPLTRRKRRLRAGALRQWAILSQRYAELICRDWVNLALLLAQTPIVAVLLTLVASHDAYTASKINNTQQVLLMLTVATLWFGTSNAAREIVKERPVYLRERMVNLRIFPYVFSKVGVLALLSAVQVVALFWIVGLKTPYLPQTGIIFSAPLEMVLTLFLTSLAALGSGLLISSLVGSTDRAMTLVPIVLIPQVIFSGAVFDLTGHSEVLSYLTISHWCQAALGSIVRINDMAGRIPLHGQVIQVGTQRLPMPDLLGSWPKEMYASPDAIHLLGYWAALSLFAALSLAGTCGVLRRRDSRVA